MLKLDATTRAEFDAAPSSIEKVIAVIDALAATVNVKVYSDPTTVVGTGTMSDPWGTPINNLLIINPVSTFSVTVTGTPDENWFIEFESGGRYLRGSFGLAGAGTDFEWSLATWELGQAGQIENAAGRVWVGEQTQTLVGGYSVAATGNQAPVWITTSIPTLTAGGTGFQLEATDPDGDDALLVYTLDEVRNSQGVVLDPTTNDFTVTPTGFLTVGNSVSPDNYTITVTADDGQGITVGDYEPAITGESQPEQYQTYDGSSDYTGGPNYLYWNTQLYLPWQNIDTGDFIDKNGIEQGTTSFSESAIIAAVGQYFDVDVSELVQKAVSTGENKGFYLVTAGSFNPTVACNGRLGANPPLLTVETDSGPVSCPIQLNANWVPGANSTQPLNSSASFTVGITRPAALRFDLSSVSGTVLSATMQLYASAKTGSNVKVRTFETNPPTFIYGAGGDVPMAGLAAEVGEQNLPSHPDVYFAGDFEGTQFYWDAVPGVSSGGEAYIPKLVGWIQIGTGANTAEVLPDPDAPGTFYYRGMFVPVFTGTDPKRGAFSNGSVYLMEGDESNPLCPPNRVIEEAYARMYVMLEDDFNTIADGNKMGIWWKLNMGYWRLGGLHGSYWQNLGGNGGVPGTGLKSQEVPSGYTEERYVYRGNSQRMESGIGASLNDPYYGARPWTGYNYNLDQFNPDGSVNQPFPGIIAYNNIRATAFRKNRWYCVEQRLKMNSIDLSNPDSLGNGVAIADGILETWINGVQVDGRYSYRWRRHPEMGIAQVTSNWYMGGRADMPDTMHWRMNHWAVAKRYIGPRVKP